MRSKQAAGIRGGELVQRAQTITFHIDSERRAWVFLALVAACLLGCHRKPLVSSWLLPSAGTYELVPTNAVFLAGTNRGPLIDVGIEYSVINTGISAVPRGAYTVDLFIDGTLICWDHVIATVPPNENMDYTFRTNLSAGQHSYVHPFDPPSLHGNSARPPTSSRARST